MPLSIGHYLNNMSKLTNQWNDQNYKEPDRQRIYLKDIDCPKLWHDKLREQLPPGIFYLNDGTGDIGGPGSADVHKKGIARCGDLMSCLPAEMRAQNMMCYIGHEGTYTPAHREMCASLGQNLMVETSRMKDEEGNPTKPGSSIWFMTETKDRHLVSEYWLSTLGHDIEVEKHFAQLAAWKGAPFTTYIVEQKVGDFILIPPLAPHQVWNRGTRTMKVAWNRTTVETLEMALHEALPRARMVCRDEQYKNKAIIYFTLHKYSDLLNQADLHLRSARNPQVLDGLRYSTKIRQLQKDFKRLFALYTEILLSEMLSPVSPSEKRGQYLPFESFVTCSYCQSNIFNRFLTCTSCIAPLPNDEEDTYDICMDCFAMGRSCSCISAYKWVEQFPWQDLIQTHESWRQQIIRYEFGAKEKPPNSLQTERQNLKKKTLAQVCQEQLRIRPWSDPKNPLQALTHSQRREIGRAPTKETNGEDDDGDEQPKKRPKRRDYMDKNYLVEHVSLYPEEKWKLATCSKCDRSYSYGSLWRMFDLMPLTVMENPNWLCPYCLKICSCGACRKRVAMKPYEPKGTVLGHDTKAVADRRSMEHLVDFSHSNMRWITAAGDDDPIESRRLHRRIEEAEIAKSHDPTLDDNYIDTADDGLFVRDTIAAEDISIDPMLDPALRSTGQVSKMNSCVAVASQNLPMGKKSSVHSNPSKTRNSPSVYESGPSLRPVLDDPSSVAVEDHPTSFISNGITYEYPDPIDSRSMPNTLQFNQPLQTQEKKSNSKRKSNSNLIQTDLVPETANSNAGQGSMSQNQLQQSLQEAREDDRYTITEAALTGKALVVTLSLPASKLAAIAQSQPSLSSSTETQSSAAKELLHSDLPGANDTTPDPGSKKRKPKSGKNEDLEFRIRQRKNRALAGGTAAPGQVRSSRASYIEANTSSGDEDVLMSDREEELPVNKSQGPRPLPKYLARRSEGQDLPDELPVEEPRRKPVPRTQKEHPRQMNSSLALRELKGELAGTGKPRGQPPKEKPRQSTSLSLADENRKAKIKAVSWANEDIPTSETSTSEDESPEPVQKTGKLMAVPVSMFDKKKLAGKKFKIASAKTAAVNGRS